MKKFTTGSFQKSKERGEKISMLTAYDYSTAKLLDASNIDCLLVGDSLGMVMLGYETTLQVTVEDIIHHCKAVARGTKRAFIVADMPFLSYHVSMEETIRNAGRIIQEGKAEAVKLEGGVEILEQIRGLIKAQIPVMGHLGLTPQSINIMGGFKVQGKTKEKAQKIIEDALLLQEAGVFAVVLECIPEQLAKRITEQLSIPTIGIGAGRYCDGQVLVTQDMLGTFSDFSPKFVKKYAQMGIEIQKACAGYDAEIKQGLFPKEEHIFSIEEEMLDQLY